MKERIRFSKLSGSGNDFICLDNMDGRFDYILAEPRLFSHFARTICHRGSGVGADGIVFASQPEIEGVAEIAATFLEPDGTVASLCGNGTACFVRWATDRELVDNSDAIRILTPAGVVIAQNLPDGFGRVCIPLPEDVRTNIHVRVKNEIITCDYALVGVEHLVIYVDDITAADIALMGPQLRHHQDFPQPIGVNANFVQIIKEGEIAVRTYEYGVEAETLACATGSTASAMLAAKRFHWSKQFTSGHQPVLVHTPGGDTLRVYFTLKDDGTICDPCIETIVRCSFEGTVCPDLAALAIEPPKQPLYEKGLVCE